MTPPGRVPISNRYLTVRADNDDLVTQALTGLQPAEHGSMRNGYPSIVAGGDNANILHYIANNAMLNDGDLLLVDAGCEYGMYSGDISRTWPVSKGMISGWTRITATVPLAKPGRSSSIWLRVTSGRGKKASSACW